MKNILFPTNWADYNLKMSEKEMYFPKYNPYVKIKLGKNTNIPYDAFKTENTAIAFESLGVLLQYYEAWKEDESNSVSLDGIFYITFNCYSNDFCVNVNDKSFIWFNNKDVAEKFLKTFKHLFNNTKIFF